MDDHLSALVNNFDNHFEQSQHELSKNSYNIITTVSSNQVSNYQPIIQNVQNINKEILTVTPIFKIEPDVLSHKNVKPEEMQDNCQTNDLKQTVSSQKRSRGHIDRYNGMTEDEVMQRKLPDYLREGLDLIVVGINPSMTSACVGHHYAGIGNHFWTCITEAGLVPEQVTCYDDYRMVDYGIGFTNVCSRPTKGAAEISRKEMKAGAIIMLEKMRKYRPKIAVFNGKGIYEAFVGHKNFYMGKQPKALDGTDIVIFVMPSSSARCAQLPRAEDKLPFFIALRKLRDFVKGRLSHLNDQEVIFTDYTEFRVTQPDPKSLRKAERRRKRKAEQLMAVTGSEQLIGLTKPRKSKTLMNNIQSQKSNSISSNKDTEYGLTTHDMTPTTIPDDSSSQIEIPVALLNQSNGVISLVPSDFLINGSLGSFNIANQNTFLTLNNKTNASVATNKPIILQQDASGQTYMLTTSSPLIQQGTTLSVPQLTALAAASSQSTTATIMPWGGNTFALIQPSQVIGANPSTNDSSNTSGLSWNNNTISVQGSHQIITQPSNLFYQKASNNNAGCQPQIICTAATLQQILQQQQQQQQIQIVNPLAFSQPIAIQTPIGINGSFGNIQFQQIANCLSENLSNDQMNSNGSDPLLQQDTLCQPSCSMTPSSSDNVVMANNSNGQNNQSGSSSIISTTNDTQSGNTHQTTILGYSVAPNSQQPTQTIGLSSNQSLMGNQNITLAYISNQHQSPHQSQTSAFSSINNSNATHIVIPISGSSLSQAGNIVQITEQQQQRLICNQASVANIVNCFTNCGSLTNGSLSNNNTINQSNNNSSNGNNNSNISVSNNNSSNGINNNNNTNNNNTNQIQSSRTIASSSSTSGISSIAGQNDLDLISSSSGVAEASTGNHLYHQHCTAPVQLADCEDQLVQCSSSDEKLVYAAL